MNKLYSVEEIKKYSYEKLYIYGAGYFAKEIKERLNRQGLIVDAFLVSDSNRITDDEISNTPVLQYEENMIQRTDLIVVGVSDEHFFVEIVEKLKGKDNVLYFSTALDGLHFVDREDTAKDSRTVGYFSNKKDLNDLGIQEKTDKAGYSHNYCNKYEFFFEKYRDQEITFVELGVFHGGSIRMWRRFFSKARVIGVDINPECQKYANEDIEVLIRDMGKEESVKDIAATNPTIIIDDASHIWSHQTSCLFSLYPILPHGGLYVVEDICTSFHPLIDTYKDTDISPYRIIEAISKGVVGDSLKDIDTDEYGENWDSISSIIRQTEAVVCMADSVILIHR